MSFVQYVNKAAARVAPAPIHTVHGVREWMGAGKISSMTVNQGDIYWVPVEDPNGLDEGYIHPQVVIQEDVINHSRVHTVVVCALTTNRKRANMPGNVLLNADEANLPKQSIVVVSQVSTVQKAQLGEYIGSLSRQRVDQILAGMRFLQRLTEHRL